MGRWKELGYKNMWSKLIHHSLPPNQVQNSLRVLKIQQASPNEPQYFLREFP